MEETYRIMLYGGIVGALITLSIAIWLYIKLDIRHVMEDLTGIRLGKSKRKQSNTSFEMWSEREHTSSQIELKKLEQTDESARQSQKIQNIPQGNKSQKMKEENFSRVDKFSVPTNKHSDEQTELLEEESANYHTELLDDVSDDNHTELLDEQDYNQTELLEETSLLKNENETELIGEEEASFEMEEEVIVTHSASNKKEGFK
ncbi:hypothetical protein SAMN04487943_11073 [Gracilibacillus orientalis]|uniref:Uncharacterized protein n=1 Tax=Gracilibacillus orientalis TaxID=334253 RepID=A0A1I4P4F6_9BACI|nr:hypothetical protein [Gracilibacillus orientalis]SFM22671.1 hypothetical protein SAMN04487943_11073 [Gracilibacillus orientalis]